MVVELADEVSKSDRNGNTILSIPAGFRFNSIEPEYMSEDTKDEIGRYNLESIKNRLAFAFFFRGYWVVVPAKVCYVHTAVGWRYNI